MHSRKLAITASILGVLACTSQASITMTLVAGTFTTSNVNSPVAEGTLFQLINLGADGIFNPISLADGDVTANGQWVSGDDTLITASYLGTTDYATLGGFDLIPGNTPDGPGIMNRTFVLTIASGVKFGIRWFPGLTAAGYYAPGGLTLEAGQNYGQFTRQNDLSVAGPLYDGPVNSGNLWITPNDGANSITLDSLRTQTVGGGEANSLGQASNVIPVVPEPGSIALAFAGAFGIFALRRRRS